MVIFDATILLLMLRPNSGRPNDSSGKPVDQVEERIAHLVQRLERARSRIIIPTPALSEVLVHAGQAAPKIVETLGSKAVFRIMPFDELAAVEAALMTRDAISSGDKRSGRVAPWAKVKFDRQIVAIAKVARATMIYTDDSDIHSLAAAEGISTTSIAELPLPPTQAQGDLGLIETDTEGQEDGRGSENDSGDLFDEDTEDEEPI